MLKNLSAFQRIVLTLIVGVWIAAALVCIAIGAVVMSGSTSIQQILTQQQSSELIGPNEVNTPTLTKVEPSQTKGPTATRDASTTIPTPLRVVEPTAINPTTTITTLPVHFWVSNQSLGTDVSEVQMTLSLNGAVIFDQLLAVEDQHNVAMIDQEVPTGAHTINVNVGIPYLLSTEKVVEITDERWVYVIFWYSPESVYADLHTPSITVDVLDKSPGIK